MPSTASAGRGSGPTAGPALLAGYCVAVASDRRRHTLADLLEAHGARTINVQAARTLQQPDLDALRAATDQVLAAPCDEVVVSSGFGLHCWLGAVRRWGLADALVERFGAARLLARDPRAADRLRELGLTTIWSTAGSATEELLRYLAAQPLQGRRIVIQADMPSLREPAAALRRAGAEVIEVPTYRSFEPTHADILRHLVEQIQFRQVDAVALLGDTVSGNLLAQARTDHQLGEVLNALCDGVLPVGLGTLSGGPLTELGVPVEYGTAPFVEELADLLVTRLPRTALRLGLAGHKLEVRGQAIVLDGALVPIQAGPMAVLRVLARDPGRVMSRAEIRDALPNGRQVDDHAIEMAVSRLRRSLAGTGLVQTVMKRGYRLAG